MAPPGKGTWSGPVNMKTAILFLTFSLATAVTVPAEDLYVSQAGGGDGSSCVSARSASWFNTSANWANPKQSGRIGPGDTILLCGTLTTSLTLQGSGITDGYVTIDGTTATLGTSFSFSTNNQSWWRIQNCTWSSGATVAIIKIVGGSNGIFTGANADNASGDPIVWLGQFNGAVRPDNITVSNSYLATGATNYGDTQHDIIKTEGSTNVVIEGNYLEMRAGGTGASAHDDVIQTYEKGGASGGPPANWTIRYNWIVMNSTVANDRSWTMLESLSGANYIYGNVFLGIQGAGSANGLCANSNQTGVIFYIYNNTFVAKGSSSNNVLNLAAPGTASITNNIFHLQDQTAITGSMTSRRSYNLWYGSSIPTCSGITGEICNQDPLFADYANNKFFLTAASPAKGTGANLGNGPTGQALDWGVAPQATWPSPTLVSRASWDRGSYQGAMPLPPSNVTIKR
jgi:hypothetical protein